MNHHAVTHLEAYDDIDNPCFGYDARMPEAQQKLRVIEQTVAKLWRWQQGGETIWLLHALCYPAVTGDGPPVGRLQLYRSGRGSATMTDIGALLPPDFYLVPASFQDAGPLAAWRIGPRLILASRTSDSVAMLDLATMRIDHMGRILTQARNLVDLRLDDRGQFLRQLNLDGQTYLIGIARRQPFLRSVEIDGEVVFVTNEGYFQGSEESAHYVFLSFPGVAGFHAISQFRSLLHRPDLVMAAIEQQRVQGTVPATRTALSNIAAPPRLDARWIDAGSASRGTSVAIEIEVAGEVPLRAIEVFQDGILRRTLPLHGNSARLSLDIAAEAAEGANWIGLRARDERGVTGLVRALDVVATGGDRLRPTLKVVAVGNNHYTDVNLAPLASAVKDAENMAAALKRLEGQTYGRVETRVLADANGLRNRLLEELKVASAGLGRGDTLLLHVAAHGLRDTAGRFYFATRETKLADVAGSAVPWSDISAALADTRARVVVLLDTCHSGAAGAAEVNDGSVADIAQRDTPVLIIAASKGRQLSREVVDGGLFTTALAEIIAHRVDLDRNRSGWLELSELYRPLKAMVSSRSGGTQTPWISRNGLVGEISLF